jgi:general secretion pathway protein H
VQRPISPARRDDRGRQAGGFTLLEVVCVVAIIAILAALVSPILPRGTSRVRLESYALATAAVLKSDRNAAIRRQSQIATGVDVASRLVRSGATSRVVQMPSDVDVEALLSTRCGPPSGGSIRFFASGMSCGGVIRLSRPGAGYEIRVNWLTGGIELVALNRG